MVLARAVGDVGRCVTRFWGLVAEGVCGIFKRWVHGGKSKFQGDRPNRQTTADGASIDADMSRSWVGTT